MNGEKRKDEKITYQKKSNGLVISLFMVIIALLAALIIMVFQYRQLTEEIISAAQKKEAAEMMTNGEQTAAGIRIGQDGEAETGGETETERLTDSDIIQSELTEEPSAASLAAQTETQDNTQPINQPSVQPANQSVIQEETQPVTQPVIQTETQPASQLAIQPETQPVTQPSAQSNAGVTPETVQTVPTAKELTIADIPNSLYAKLKNPEELRNTLFSWLENRGASNYLYCSCDYDYRENGDTLIFLLRFSGFNVEVTYNTAGNVYSYGLA